MKVRHLFELIQDAKDVADCFEGVETSEQMVSALERLKKRDPEEFMVLIQTLRMSTQQLLDDTFEMSGFDPNDEETEDDVEGEDFNLEGLGLDDEESPPAETNQNHEAVVPGEVKKVG